MKKLAIIFFICLLLSMLLSIIRGGYIPSFFGLSGYSLSAFINFIVYAILTLFILRKIGDNISPYKVLLTVIIGVNFIAIIILCLYSNTTLVATTLPSVFVEAFGAILGYVIYKIRSIPLKITLSLVGLFLVYFITSIGYQRILNMSNFGSYTGRIEHRIDKDIEFSAFEGSKVALSDFKGKYVILDFWGSSCGYCFDAFPQVESLYQYVKSDSNIELFGVFCSFDKTNETFEDGYNIIKNLKYNFPTLSLSSSNPILKEIGVRAYPTVVIFDPESEIVFRGNIKDASEYVKELRNNN